jgi:hypothetical protein
VIALGEQRRVRPCAACLLMCRSGMGGVPGEDWFFCEKPPPIAEEPPRVPVCHARVLVQEVLPAVMPTVPTVPEFLPAPPPELALPTRLSAGLPTEGRAALAGPAC